MNDVATQAGGTLALRDDELLGVLRSSLYPGAKDESIKLVLAYCKAAGLDPMQKPVHIVPMEVATGAKGADGWPVKEWRDCIMPGIGLYRTNASRTGQLAGIDEPIFGDAQPMPGAESRQVPEWCKVTVYRLVGGQRVGFTALEYWQENYATKGRGKIEPNAMWSKRPRGQLAKCAEAQALRKAFPELGSAPTADETIISHDDEGAPLGTPAAVGFTVGRKTPAADPVTDATVVENQKVDKPVVDKPAPVKSAAVAEAGFCGLGEIAYLRNKAAALEVDLTEVLAECGGLVLEQLTKADFGVVKAELLKRGAS